MIEYEDNAEFKAAVEKMLDDTALPEFNPIREEEITIFSLLCIRTDADGEHVQCKGPPIICRKIPPPFQALTDGHYLIIGDYYFWNHVDENQQNASLYHALMHINVEKSEKGEVKIGSRKPEVQVFCSEVARYGAHNDVLLGFREVMKQSGNRFAQGLKSRA